MKESGVIRIKEHPKLMREAALWFHEKRGEVPVSAYLESMKESLRGETSVPGWYLYITGGSIAAGAGVIENDFLMTEKILRPTSVPSTSVQKSGAQG